MIQVSLLNKYYNKGKRNELHVINNTTLTLEDTGFVCILGESGSGKTTLMNTISGLDDFHDGTITIDEHEIKRYGSRQQEAVRNESFGYIFQNYYLLMDRTVEYNISLALSLYHLSEKEEQERIDYVLKAVDMERYKKRRVAQLSGGQQQRVAIARAIAKTPRVIFADEPTGNLDEANTIKIMGILKKMSETCLVVLVTHERSIAECFADRIIWITDGKIERDELSDGAGSYQTVQDQNLYLREYDKVTGQTGNILVEQYRKKDLPSEDGEKPLLLQIIYENGTYYVYAPEGGAVEYLSENKEKKVINDYRPHLNQEEAARLGDGYKLDPLTVKGTPKLSGKEIFRLARQNLAALGKKQIFLAVALLVMSVLVVLTLQDIMTMYMIDERSIVTVDSHLVEISVAKNDLISDADLRESILDLLNEIQKEGGNALIYPIARTTVSYYYEGFWQLEDMKAALKGFCVLPLECISENDLIYGELADEPGEIVVDRWLLENFMASDNMMANIITSIETFTEGYFLVGLNHYYRIVGITDIGEPDIFVNATEGLTWMGSEQGNMLVTESTLKNNLPEQFADLDLKSGQIMLAERMAQSLAKQQYRMQFDFWENVNYYKIMLDNYETMENEPREYWEDLNEEEFLASVERIKKEIESCELALKNYEEMLDENGRYVGVSYEEYQEAQEHPESLTITYDVNSMTYEVVGTVPDDYLTKPMVISDEDADAIKNEFMASKKTFYIYTDNKDAMIKKVNRLLTDEVKEKVNVKATDARASQLKAAIAARDIKVNARMILTVTIFVVSLIILYFMMKASAINRVEDLAVYRLLGITKGSICLMFALEAAMFSCRTTLVGVAATTLVTKFLSSIPSLQISINYPWYMAALTFLALFLIHIVTGVLPIMRLLRLPPARLASKYDI